MRVFMPGRNRGDDLKRTFATGFVCACLFAPLALAQSPVSAPGGATRVADAIQARQLLMDAIEEQMMPLEVVAARKDPPLPELKNRAYLISVLMTAFPHLFFQETRPGEGQADPSSETKALPGVWTSFDAFYDASQMAANIALDASQAANLSHFRNLAQKLRAACDSCHADYMAATDPSKP